eukprot:939171-Amphidinium_carterae.1
MNRDEGLMKATSSTTTYCQPQGTIAKLRPRGRPAHPRTKTTMGRCWSSTTPFLGDLVNSKAQEGAYSTIKRRN